MQWVQQTFMRVLIVRGGGGSEGDRFKSNQILRVKLFLRFNSAQGDCLSVSTPFLEQSPASRQGCQLANTANNRTPYFAASTPNSQICPRFRVAANFLWESRCRFRSNFRQGYREETLAHLTLSDQKNYCFKYCVLTPNSVNNRCNII